MRIARLLRQKGAHMLRCLCAQRTEPSDTDTAGDFSKFWTSDVRQRWDEGPRTNMLRTKRTLLTVKSIRDETFITGQTDSISSDILNLDTSDVMSN
ncbi:hypothetical protein IRJ41_018143 [Triplophysa rosa]|uniref:Uncharacterized protein n=1 Tax=Triplophysa rosa TaxID=992332 RepID=A0A9W7TLA1_TRIRA|nr:hypothetical protein IRJ41_018143 [Triplophysa rosa]